MAQKQKAFDISYKLFAIEVAEDGFQEAAVLPIYIWRCIPEASINRYQSRLNASLILKLGLESQEGNRSLGLYSSIYSIIFLMKSTLYLHIQIL